ncbi:hypothetical protein KI688_012171 [Linnemannia hyalina]|uniref:Acetyl-CoA synthetase-like protein n=1 Tax=Linnemannia hyalina TaxID=64524 RepID=A0A9P8BTM9_9FUNG|nr:hypothetical protein KI688_012171 [Linnemannia hyalina]
MSSPDAPRTPSSSLPKDNADKTPIQPPGTTAATTSSKNDSLAPITNAKPLTTDPTATVTTTATDKNNASETTIATTTTTPAAATATADAGAGAANAIVKPSAGSTTPRAGAKDGEALEPSKSGTSSGTALHPVANYPLPPPFLSTSEPNNKNNTSIVHPLVNADGDSTEEDNASEIASDIQEHSQHSDNGSIQLVALDDEENEAGQTNGHTVEVVAKEGGSTAPADNNNNSDNKPPANKVVTSGTEAPVSVVNISKAPSTTVEPSEGRPHEEPEESVASYTSPNFEWARILQKRLGKNLSDAQLLARSNSMLASPSILAQSLTQVIPSLQVKETSPLSPGTTIKYQTAEELFDRPASIEPSVPAYKPDEQPARDDPFPSSAFASSSHGPLLLFAPLNPDQLYGKNPTTIPPTAPPPAAENSSQLRVPRSQPQPPPTTSPAQMQQPHHQPAAQQPGLVAIHAIPTQRNSPISIPHSMATATPTQPSRNHLGGELHQSPLMSRDAGPGARNIRHSIGVHIQDDRLAANSHSNTNHRTLNAQNSSSSLVATSMPPNVKDQHGATVSNYPIAPIQYTPLTQYKPIKKAHSLPAPVKETPAPIKETPAPVLTPSADPPTDTAHDQDLAATTPTPASAIQEESKPDPTSTSAADTAPQWALEALSGFSDINFDTTLPVGAAVATTLASTSHSSEAPSKTPMIIPPISVRSRSNLSVNDASPGQAKQIQSPFESAQQNIERSSPVKHGHNVQGNHQAGRSISSLREVQIGHMGIERASLDVGHQRRGDTASLSDITPSATTGVPPMFDLGSGYQISWLPQSQPLLPRRDDINSIDVPALTGKQLLPLEPREVQINKQDPCLQFKHIGEALRHWGQLMPEGNAFANLDGKGIECGSWDWSFTLGKAEMVAKAIHDKTQLRVGSRVALVFRISEILEFVAAFYGAILAGMVPVLVNQIQEFSEMVYIMTSARVELALTTQFNHQALHKDMRKGALWPAGVTWWQTDILETWAPKNGQQERSPLPENELAYIEYTKSASGELKGVAVSHLNLMTQCRSLYSSFLWRPALFRDKHNHFQADPNLTADASVAHSMDGKVNPDKPALSGTVMSWLEPRQQSGLVLGAIMGVFCGNFTVFMEAGITAVSGLWAHSVAAYRANITFTDYSGIQRLLKNYRINPQATTTPSRPDLRFLHTVYVDVQCNNVRLNREFLDDFLYPLGMIQRFCISKDDLPGLEAASKKCRSDLGLITFLSLPDHGGMIVALRDPLTHPKGVDKIELRKTHRMSVLPKPRRPSLDQADDSNDQGSKNSAADAHGYGSLMNSPVSSLTAGEYLLHRAALRANRIIVLATGKEAFDRRNEEGTVLVGAFGYALAQSSVLVVDPETLALSLPDSVGEIWVSYPGQPMTFWGLPEHSQEIFQAKPYIVTEEAMIPQVYAADGSDRLLRTGLLGAVIEGRIVVFGSYWDRLQQDQADPMKTIGFQYEYHHASDLSQTLFNRVGGISEVSIFECQVNKDFLPVICIEITKESRANGQPINTVAQQVAINARYILQEVNALRSYCIAVWDMNALPRIFKNGRRVVDHALCKVMFTMGRIYKLLYFATFTDDVLFNVPQGDDLANGFWSRECAAKRQRRQGSAMRFVQYTSNIASSDAYDEKANVFMGKFHNITDIVMWRSMIQPDDAAFVELDSRGKEQRTISFKKFNQRVTGYAMYLEKKCALKAGDHVILWFSQDLDYVVTLHACWVLGLIPIPLQLPDHPHTNAHPTAVSLVGLGAAINGPTIAGSNATTNHASAAANRISEEKKSAILTALFCILDEVKVKAILGNMATDDFLKQKTTGTSLRARRAEFSPVYVQTPEAFSTADIFLPAFHNVTKAPKNKQTLGALSGYAPRKEWFAATYPAVYLIDPEVRVGSVAFRRLLKLNHETLNSLCRNQKLQFKVHSGQANIACMNIFNGLGFIRGCLSGIYSGGPTVLLQPADVYANPNVWIEAVSRYKALTYPLLEQLLQRLDSITSHSTASLESIKNFVVCGHERVQRNALGLSRLSALKLDAASVNILYSHSLNLMVTSQSDRATGPIRIHVSSKQLRYGIISPTTEGDDKTGIWLEDVGTPTVCTSVAIVNPETMEVCTSNQVGEIWVCSDSSTNGFHYPPGYQPNPSQPQPFGACIAGYDSRVRYVRTGDLGFLWNNQHHQLANQGQWNPGQSAVGLFQLFVLGSLDESFHVQGLLHFAADIESTVESSHANVAAQGCVAFRTPKGKAICVVKVQKQDPEVLVSMYIPLMHAILDQHQFLPDTIALVGDSVSTARRASDGLKPRDTIAGLYLSDRLPLLHLHYCHGKPLAPVLGNMLPVTGESPPNSRGSNRSHGHQSSSQQSTLISQPQPISQQQQLPTATTGSRLVTGIGPAPMSNLRGGSAPAHLYGSGFSGSNNHSPVEPHGNSGSRNSIFGSPLLLANIPMPPGTINPLVQSPMGNNAVGGLGGGGYVPQTQYQQSGYGAVPISAPTSIPVSISTPPHHQQSVSPPNTGMGYPPVIVSAMAVQATFDGIGRPMSQQGFVSSPPNTGGSNNTQSSSTGASSAPGRGPSSGDRPRGLQHQHSHLHQQPSTGGQRATHPRQIRGQEARSSSSEELRLDGKPGSGGAVKNIMKGVNAKWSEMRKAGLN